MDGQTGEWQRTRHSMQRRAQRRLPELLLGTGGHCFWCKRHIVILRLLDRIVSQNAHHVVYRVGNSLFRSRIASADHVVRVIDGGGTENNLVPSCTLCNGARNRQHFIAKSKKLCRTPGCTAKRKTRRYCTPCWYARAVSFLHFYGWELWPDPLWGPDPNGMPTHPRSGWWQDPETMFLLPVSKAVRVCSSRLHDPRSEPKFLAGGLTTV